MATNGAGAAARRRRFRWADRDERIPLRLSVENGLQPIAKLGRAPVLSTVHLGYSREMCSARRRIAFATALAAALFSVGSRAIALPDLRAAAISAALTPLRDKSLPLDRRLDALRNPELAYGGREAAALLVEIILEEKNPSSVRTEAATALVNVLREEPIGRNGQAWPAPDLLTIRFVLPLAGSIRGGKGEPHFRALIADVLGRLGEAARPAIADLTPLLRDRHPEVRTAAARALGGFAAEATSSRKALMAAFKDPTSPRELRVVAAESLLRFRDEESSTLLIDLAEDLTVDISLRRVAAKAVVQRMLAGNNAMGREGPSPKLITRARTAYRNLLAVRDQDPDLLVYALILTVRGSESPCEDALRATLRRLAGDVRDARIRQRALGRLAQCAAGDPSAVNEEMLALAARRLNFDGSDEVRTGALNLLKLAPPDDGVVTEEILRHAMDDPVMSVRSACVSALGERKVFKRAIVAALLPALRDEAEPAVRANIASVLATLGDEDPSVSRALADSLANDSAPVVRATVAATLGRVRVTPEAIAALRDALEDEDQDQVKRVIGAIGRFRDRRDAILLPLLYDKQREPVWAEIMTSLASEPGLSPAATKAAADLLATPGDARVHAVTVYALGTSLDPGRALPELTRAASTPGQTREALDAATLLSRRFAEERDSSFLPELSTAEATFVSLNLEHAELTRNIALLRTVERTRWTAWLLSGAQDRPLQSLAVLYLLLLWLVYRLKPNWISRLDAALWPLEQRTRIPVSKVLLFGFLRSTARVMDAWVEDVAPVARTRFAREETVLRHPVRIATDTLIGGVITRDLPGRTLRERVDERRCVILIQGEGGSGKTNLLCHLGRLALAEERSQRLSSRRWMLPILVDADIHDAGTTPAVLVATVQSKLKELAALPDLPRESLVRSLLRSGRILLLIDRFSELDRATRNLVQPGTPAFPAACLVLASRLDERLGGTPRLVLEPCRLRGNRIAELLQKYLAERKHSPESDETLFRDCALLSRIAGKDGSTLMLATMYAEYLIGRAEAEAADVPRTRAPDPPRNVPDLMGSYLSSLNATVLAARDEEGQRSENVLDHATVHQATKIVAWECVHAELKPRPASRAVVRAALELGIRTVDPDVLLTYLEKRLRLLRTLVHAPDTIEMTLDPLCEYLAAFHLFETHRRFGEPDLDKLLRRIGAASNDPDMDLGFARAVVDVFASERLRQGTSDSDPRQRALFEFAGQLPALLDKRRALGPAPVDAEEAAAP